MAIYVKSVREFFAKYFKREEIEEDKASKFETYLSIIYKLLIWEDPFLSGVALAIAHVLFWAVIYFELRLYGIFCISLIILFGIDAVFDNIMIQTDRSIPLKNIRESIKVCSAFLHYLTSLRKEHPGTFCICMCTGFLILSLIGRTLSGLILSYFGLISLLLIPGIIYRLPPEVLDAIRHTLHVISTNDGVVHEHELLPSQEGLLAEKDEDGDSMRTDHTADSCTNSFISGVTSMPSYLEAEGSLDGLDEEDLEFTKNLPEVNPSNYSSDSSDNEHKDMKFEVSHFNRDSSSDEEHNYEQGLAFSEIDTADKTQQPTVSFTQQFSVDLLSNLGSMGSSLMSTVLKTAASAATPAKITKRTDSDSDFEIIDSDDIKTEET